MRSPGAAAAAFDILTEGRARVVGALEFATVSALLPLGTDAIDLGHATVIDLAGVCSSDSSGLALLIEWLSVAKSAGKRLRFENVPPQIHDLARLSDVDEMLDAG